MGALHIGDWHNAYRVPAGARLRPGLDRDLDALVPRLAESLAGSAADLLGPDAQVILIPELALDCTLDASCPADSILRHWSAELAQSLARTLADPAGGVVRFHSRAAFQAAFVADLVRGLAWGRWWYRGFEGLRVLPPGAAIRTLVGDHPAAGHATLSLVEESLWPALARTLGPREAIRILWAWHDWGPRAESPEPGGEWTAPPLPERLRGCPALPPPLLALYLIARRLPKLEEPPSPARIGLACWLALLLAQPPGHGIEALANSGNLRRLAPVPDAQDPDWIALLALADPGTRSAAAGIAAAARRAAQPGRRKDTEIRTVPAPFGGLVWLLPALRDLLFTARNSTPVLVSALPRPPTDACWDAGDAAARITLSILAGEGGTDLAQDPFWCAFLRLPPGLDPEDLSAWLGDQDPVPALEALASSLTHLALGEPVLLRPPGQHGARGRAFLAERGTACPLDPVPCAPGSEVETPPIPFRERLALTRALGRDIATLGASPILARLPAPWRQLFVCLAQGTLRRTANRIPGSARASLHYLTANVFGIGGEARVEGWDLWRLQLERPPLHVLLALNGMARLDMSWPGGRHLVVHCRA